MLRETPVGAAAPASPAPAAPIPEAVTNQGDERFRRWYEATFEDIAIHEKGIILEANQPLAALLARPPGELIGKNLLDRLTRASRDLIEESILLGNYRPFEALACRADKTELHLELYTKQISYQGKTVMVSALCDITERKRPAAARQAGFDPATQLGHVAQWVLDNHESFVASQISRDDSFQVNQPVNFLGAYIGLPLLDGKKFGGVLFALETEPRHFKPEDLDFLNALANRAATVIVKARLYPALSEANQLLQAQSTDLRVKNQELAVAKEAAEATNRAKSEFLATMSHELRTPLNGILGLSNMLLQSKLDADQQDSAEGVHASAEDLLETISRILDFSKLESRQHALQSSKIDVRQMIHGAVANGRRRMAGKTIQFHTMLGSELPARVRGDDAALQQILTHLVDNAVKFTDRGEVAVGAVKSAEHGRHLTLRFTVSDTGIGISPEAQTRLFQSFTQVDGSHSRRFGGVGLGLAISKHLIELMGGKIGVESTPGEGSAFWFTLPFEKAACPSGRATLHFGLGPAPARFAAWNLCMPRGEFSIFSAPNLSRRIPRSSPASRSRATTSPTTSSRATAPATRCSTLIPTTAAIC